MDILTIFIFIIVGIILTLVVLVALKFLLPSLRAILIPTLKSKLGLDPTLPKPPSEVSPKAMRKPLDENVQFTVFRPRAIDTVGWYQLLAYAHLSERRPGTPKSEPHPQAEVNRKAREALGPQFHGFASLMADSPQAIPQQSVLSFVPTIEGIEFVPTHQMILWEGPVHEMIFKMRARSQEMEGQVARGHLRVYLGIILVAEVALAVRVDTELAREYGEAPPEPEVTVSPYRKIFASYSHKDEPVVVQFEQLVEAFGDKYLRDVRDIRAGEKWNERLEELIREADIFQLFWSSHSMRSPFVRQEWEYALSLDKRHFIRPTFWEEPMPQDEQNKLPPEELVTLQFKRVPIRVDKERKEEEDIAPPIAEAAASAGVYLDPPEFPVVGEPETSIDGYASEPDMPYLQEEMEARRAEEETRRRAEEEAVRQRAAEEARLRAEEEQKRRAEEERQRAEAERQRQEREQREREERERAHAAERERLERERRELEEQRARLAATNVTPAVDRGRTEPRQSIVTGPLEGDTMPAYQPQFQASSPGFAGAEPKKSGMPVWIIAVLGFVLLVALVGGLIWYFSGGRQQRPDVPVGNPTPAPVADANPLSVSSRGFSGPLANRGERADYNLSLVNNGRAPVRNVKATIGLPEGLEFVRFRFSPNTPRNAQRARWNKETRQITWEIGEIAPAASNQSTPMEIFVMVRRVGNVGLVEADKVKTRVTYEDANGKKYEE